MTRVRHMRLLVQQKVLAGVRMLHQQARTATWARLLQQGPVLLLLLPPGQSA